MNLWFELEGENTRAEFGSAEGMRKGCARVGVKVLEDNYILVLVSCFDKYEDGYCIFLCNNNPIKNIHSNIAHKLEYTIEKSVMYRGNSDYPSKYYNKDSGTITFNSINKIEDMNILEDDIYFYIDRHYAEIV